MKEEAGPLGFPKCHALPGWPLQRGMFLKSRGRETRLWSGEHVRFETSRARGRVGRIYAKRLCDTTPSTGLRNMAAKKGQHSQ